LHSDWFSVAKHPAVTNLTLRAHCVARASVLQYHDSGICSSQNSDCIFQGVMGNIDPRTCPSVNWQPDLSFQHTIDHFGLLLFDSDSLTPFRPAVVGEIITLE